MALKVVLLSSCGHLVHQERPAEVDAEMIDFLRRRYMTKGTDISCPASIFRTMRPKSPVARLQTRLERSTREVKH